MRLITALTFLIALGIATVLWFDSADAAPHWELDISWTQPAPLPSSVKLERKLGANGTYATLPLTLAAGALSATDVGPYTDGQVVCVRVVAQSTGGVAIGDETCAGAPVQMPGKPGAPTINWRFVPTP